MSRSLKQSSANKLGQGLGAHARRGVRKGCFPSHVLTHSFIMGAPECHMLLKALGVCSKPAQPPGSSTVVETVNKQEDAENPEGNEGHGEEETGQGMGSADGKAGADFAEAPPPRGPLSSPRKEDGEE